MKKKFSFIFILLSSTLLFSQHKTNTLYQYSTINALTDGVFDGELSIGELKKNGDFGIGTFNALDGEMIVLDGFVYKARPDSNGSIYVIPAAENDLTPFAVITFFRPDTIFYLTNCNSLNDLEKTIDSLTSSSNLIFSIKVIGRMELIKARSVAKQQKPYKKLTDAVKQQSVNEFKNTDGTLVAFHFPEYMKNLNVEGYHWHFISLNKKQGGHVFSCQLKNASIEIEYLNRFQLQIPGNETFKKAGLKANREEIEKIEKTR